MCTAADAMGFASLLACGIAAFVFSAQCPLAKDNVQVKIHNQLVGDDSKQGCIKSKHKNSKGMLLLPWMCVHLLIFHSWKVEGISVWICQTYLIIVAAIYGDVTST